jgi:hypothetical protein
VYQNFSKLALRLFSEEKNTMTNKIIVINHPVTPGPVAKLAWKKTPIRAPVVVADASAMANLAKFTMWDMICITVAATMEYAVALWNVKALSKGMMSLRGVRRSREMKFRQTGKRIKTTST